MRFANRAIAALRPARSARPLALRLRAPSVLLLVAMAAPAVAQTSPAPSATTFGGRLNVSAQAAASVGTSDEAYFDYSSYDYGLLSLFRLDGAVDLRITDRLSLLGDLRVLASTENGHWLVRPYALFARVRPWRARAFDIQAGLIPPVFGAFSRRAYPTDNPLIGYPLAYQYLTSLRADALPATTADLLRMRGRGWLASYPVGNLSPQQGLPLVDAIRYPAGVEVHAGVLQPFEASAAWTSGALSTPGYTSGNGGTQVSGRVAVRPAFGLVLGVSGSLGTFVSRSLVDALASRAGGDQRAVGFDGEYSRGHVLVRTEGILSEWRLPSVGPSAPPSLRAFGGFVEGRYRITPGLYAAARFDDLGFSDVPGPAGPTPWDSPVRRTELGGGYSLWRKALIKVVWQRNHRELYGPHAGTGSYGTVDLVSAQLVVWF
jgi:hypothetical protein